MLFKKLPTIFFYNDVALKVKATKLAVITIITGKDLPGLGMSRLQRIREFRSDLMRELYTILFSLVQQITEDLPLLNSD